MEKCGVEGTVPFGVWFVGLLVWYVVEVKDDEVRTIV
jgi:hypothetical protein